jgi:hypothetical protein
MANNENLPALIAQAEEKVKQVPALAEKHGTKVKIAVAAVAGVVAAPFVLMGIGGLIGGTIIVAGAYAVMHLAPVYARRVQNAKQELLYAEANRHLQALKAESRKNPVETLQTTYLERESALKKNDGDISKFATKVNNYKMKVQGFKKQFPEDAPFFEQTVADMEQLLAMRRAKWQKARDDLNAFAKVIERADAMWQMGQATADLRQSAGELDETFIQKIRKETALDAVQESLAASMADLDQMMMREIDLTPPSQRPTLSNNTSPTIEVNARVVAEQPVNRS